MNPLNTVFSECNSCIDVNHSHGICRILLNDPHNKNALSKDMLRNLMKVLHMAEKDPVQKIVILRGAGGIFSSGADLQWMKEGLHQTKETNKEEAGLFYDLFDKLYHFPKPIIVWIERFAYGGALGLMACADYVIADKTARFCFSEVKLGLVPATILPFVIDKIGVNHTKKLMLSAEVFDAKKAKQIGLVDKTCQPDKMEEKVQQLCDQLLTNSPEAIIATKQLIRKLQHSLLQSEARNEMCCETIAKARASADGQEGIKAFLEKRTAKWRTNDE